MQWQTGLLLEKVPLHTIFLINLFRSSFARGRVLPVGKALLVGSALLGGALLLGACEYRASSSEAGQALRQKQKRATAPDQVSRDVEFFIYEDDRPRALVEAGRMERYEREDSTYTLLHGPPDGDAHAAGSHAAGPHAAGPSRRPDSGRVTVRIFSNEPAGNENDAPRKDDAAHDSVSATIHANRLVYHDAERRFDARGRVVVITAGGKRLEGEHLAWLEEERRITTPGFVKITTPTDRIQGYGLHADENLDSYQLGRVTGQVTVEEAP